MNFGLYNVSITDDDIAEVAAGLWKKIMNNSSDDMTKFVEFMELLSQANKGFKHVMLTESKCTHTGCLWQTVVMRDNFERFGRLDASKREINMLLWNHKAATLINEVGMMCLGCKGILCTERLLGHAG